IYMVFTKLFYYFYIIALPFRLTDIALWTVILGWLVMHVVGGFLMAIIFQPAHVLEHHVFHDGEESKTLGTDRLLHQLQT
ncbi:MAG: acyl-CoA desaturase, partial [Flavobacteriales bacterium]